MINGQWFITGDSDGVVQIWDAETGRLVSDALRHHAEIPSVTCSADGRCVLTTSADRTVRLWEPHTGRPLAEPLRFEGYLSWAQFSPDGQALLTVAGREAPLWDIRPAYQLTAPLPAKSQVPDRLVSPDGRRAVRISLLKAAYPDGQAPWQDQLMAQIIDTQTRRPLFDLPVEGNKIVADFSPDGKRVGTAWGFC